MTQDEIEAMKQWLEALEKSQSALAEELSAWDFDSSLHHIQESHDLCGPAITAIKEAIRGHAMYEVQRLGQEIEQEPVAWVCCGSGEKHDIDFYEDDVNALPVGTMLYTHPLQLKQNFCPRCGKRTNDIHTCTPPQRTEQEPVKLPCCGYTDASAVKWNPFNCVVQCHNCGQTYTQPQRTWVGLTVDEILSALEAVDPETKRLPKGLADFAYAIQAKLKEKNI